MRTRMLRRNVFRIVNVKRRRHGFCANSDWRKMSSHLTAQQEQPQPMSKLGPSLAAEIDRLREELRLNAARLAQQCDLARTAETELTAAKALYHNERDNHAATLEQLAAVRKDAARLQANVDSLMLEYCPDEMPPAQLLEWARHQRIVSDEQAVAIKAAKEKP